MEDTKGVSVLNTYLVRFEKEMEMFINVKYIDSNAVYKGRQL